MAPRFYVFAILIFLAVSGTAHAVFNDVSLTTDVVLQVNGVTLNVSGSTASIESITVDSASFSVNLSSGSSITVSAPDRNELSANALATTITIVCNSSASSITLTHSGPGTVTRTAVRRYQSGGIPDILIKS